MEDQKPSSNPEPDKEQFADIFEEMVELLHLAVTNSEKEVKGPLPDDLDEKLEALSKDVEEFCRLNEEIKRAAQAQNPTMPSTPLAALSKREKHIYKRSKEVMATAEQKMIAFEEMMRDISSKGPVPQKRESLEARKKQYKRFSMSQKWKHL